METVLQVSSTVGIVLTTVFLLGMCIFVHELGHLAVAMWRRLHVECFSLGFGRRLWGFHWRGVDFIVSLLPFGGYVALPQLDPTDKPQAADGAELPRVGPLDRVLTVVAGPLANVVFGFLLAALVWWVGVYRPPPAAWCDVASVPGTSPEYRAGLRPGDRVVSINGRRFSRGWAELSEAIALSAGEVRLGVQRGSEQLDVRYRPAPNPQAEGVGWPLFDVRTPVVVNRAVSGSPAEAAGLLPGDAILRVNGQAVDDKDAFITGVKASGGAEMMLTVERRGVVLPPIPVTARLLAGRDGKEAYRIGAELDAPMVLVHFTPWAQFVNVVATTRNTVRLLFVKESLVRPRHLSGPVGIVNVIWLKIYLGGLREGLWFVVFVSFSLALLNLFPIPVLDGGHIVFALLEAVARRPVPARFAYGLQMGFAVLLITFMLYITYFDVKRVGASWRALHPKETVQPAGRP